MVAGDGGCGVASHDVLARESVWCFEGDTLFAATSLGDSLFTCLPCADCLRQRLKLCLKPVAFSLHLFDLRLGRHPSVPHTKPQESLICRMKTIDRKGVGCNPIAPPREKDDDVTTALYGCVSYKSAAGGITNE